MRGFSDYNPIAVSLYVLSVAGIAMFCMNPTILVLSLFASVLLFFVKQGKGDVFSHIALLALFFAMALINPLVSHNGATVLFVINDSIITAEALIYGFAAAAMIISVIYWFRSFSALMTEDKLLYVFGSFSPKTALILSMGIRYISLLGRQRKKTEQAQRAMGLYKEDNIVDRTKGGIRIFSVIVTWALENGIITADSMAARGYGLSSRTHFSKFKFHVSDAVLIISIICADALIITAISLGTLDFAFYPKLCAAEPSLLGSFAYVAYAALVFLPVFIEVGVSLKWKFLRSKI
ncbi:MAG: cobalt transport protein [Clostridia bacterium]|nr:cobalt transport protein [Clostridia bacterium]